MFESLEVLCVCFFKQKTAYEMRISDWSSDVCSSDLAHLPGMLAAKTAVPVLGVPVQSKALNGMDSLLSIVQMPAGIPVATFAIGNAGASNAALFAAALLAVDHADVAESLSAFRQRQSDEVAGNDDPRVPIRS